MDRKQLHIKWNTIDGAFTTRRKLRLVRTNNLFLCNIKNCIHSGFRSGRGLRKHINSKHAWWYWFDSEPDITDKIEEARKKKSIEKFINKGSFSINEGLGKQFCDWLSSDLGGGRSVKEGKLSAKRAMKFLFHATGCAEADSEELTSKFLDFATGSALIITNFVKVLQDEWEIGFAGAYNYLTSIQDLMDFRKSEGVQDEVLRNYAVTEVYLRRGKRNLSKKRKAEWSRNFDLENLISKNSWASLEEMETVIPFHLPRFKKVVECCRDNPNDALVSDLTFATRFITTFLFLKVKCTRPMTFQYFTIEMFEKAKGENGFVDQRSFKTKEAFMFDSFIMDLDVIRLIDLYVIHCRPLLRPKCEFLLVTGTGQMCQNLCYAMTILVHQAIQKYINPTRFRQIIETTSSDRLDSVEQEIVTKDQKHNSTVSAVYYKKKSSREIAEKGKTCVDKMAGNSRVVVNESIKSVLSDIDKTKKSFDLTFLPDDIATSTSSKNSSCIVIDDHASTLDTVLQEKVDNLCTNHVVEDDLDVKIEEIRTQTRSLQRFSEIEDENLSKGMEKYGKHSWAAILSDKDFTFHKDRTRDSLRVRASSVNFKRKFKV